jgi:hypothetical protein
VNRWLWVSRAAQPLPDNVVHAELDRVGAPQVDLCRDFFCGAVPLELAFFETAYTGEVLLRLLVPAE